MRLTNLVVVALFASAAEAQQPIRVLRHPSSDTARPGDVITIAFDRPVAGSRELAADPARFVHIRPALDGRIEWRDPATLRIMPRRPLSPGSVYGVTVDTTWSAIDGGKLAVPYRFTLRLRGPALLASVPALHIGYAATLSPNGWIRLLYSASVDSATFARTARLQIDSTASCRGQVLRYVLRRQRPLDESDDYAFRYAGGWERDTTADQFRRVVELHPVSAPPEGCPATLVIPSLDPNDRAEIRYRVRTQPQFALESLDCRSDDCAAHRTLYLQFSAPVRRLDAVRYVRLSPAVDFVMDEQEAPAATWALRFAVKPRTTYRLAVDPAMRDVFGRRISGKLDAMLTTGDRRPTLAHQLDFFTVPRRAATLRVTHVNVDTAQLIVVPIPDSLRTVVLAPTTDPDSVARLVSRLRDTVRQMVSLRAPFNEERITDVPIPTSALARAGSSLLAVRLWQGAGTRRGAGPRHTRGRLRESRISGGSDLPWIAPRTAIVQVTDLAAHVRIAVGDGAVFVTDVNDGRPVAGAQVTVRDARDRVMGTGVTDATGVAEVNRVATWHDDRPADPEDESHAFGWWETGADPAHIVEVTRGNDRSIIPLRTFGFGGSPLDPYRVGARYARASVARAAVYTERGIYRPGETVYLGAILRLGALGDLRLPRTGDSLRLRIVRSAPGYPQTETVRDTVLRVTEFGTVADSFRFRPTAALGSYTVRADAHDGDRWQAAGGTSFRIAEYRAPEFAVALTIDSAVRYLGDTVRARGSGSYYFGAPMARAVVSWSASTHELSGGVSIPRLPEGFVVGETSTGGPVRSPRYHTASGIDTLDVVGKLTLSVPTARGALTGPAQLQLSIGVTDVNRQSVTASSWTSIHAAGVYVAARDSGSTWYWSGGKPKTIQLLTIRPTGERVAGVRVRVAVVHHRMTYSAQGEGSYPIPHWASDTILRDSAVTADSIVPWRFTPRSAGVHEVVLTASDESGRASVTSLGQWVIPPRWAGAWGETPVRLPLRLAREFVAPGDTAVIELLSPFRNGEAWVMAEREGVVWQHRFRVGLGEATLRVPVTARFMPGVQLSVVVVDSGAAWRVDSLHDRLRVGYAELHVDPASKRLTVDVRAAAREYAPGDNVRIAVQVRDAAGRGRRGEVTLWAVDEGVLALTGFSRPDPMAAIYAPRGTSLMFASTLAHLAGRRRLVSPPGWDTRELSPQRRGLGSAVAMAAANEAVNVRLEKDAFTAADGDVRSDFRTTAFYLAALVTDSTGAATARVRLPDNITTYRIMAVAATNENAFGAGEDSLLVTKPLLARAALPRFVRAGDELTAGVVISSRAGDARRVRVEASGRGVTLRGAGAAESTLAPGRGAEIRFQWSAGERDRDSVAFRFAVTGDGDADALELSLLVRPPYAPRFHTVGGVARDTQTVRLALPPGIDPLRSRLTLRVGTTPVPVIRSAWERMRVYSYYCTEQLTSIGSVAVAMLRLAAAGVIDSTNATEVRTKLQVVVDELDRRQRHDGAIGYWTREGWSSPWLSASAGLLLVDARTLGAEVRPQVFERLAGYVRFQVDSAPWMRDSVYGTRAERARRSAWRLSNELAVLHYLRRIGKGDSVRENRVLASRSRMPWEDRVWLADLLGRRTDRAAARALLAEVWRDVEMAGARVDIPDSLLATLGFPSHVRPPARLLAATLAINPEHRLLAPLIERVVQQGRAAGPAMWNTQDYSAAATALAEVALQQHGAGRATSVTVRALDARGNPDRVLWDRATSGDADSAVTLAGLVERQGDWMVARLRVEITGAPAYYSLTVAEVPVERPTTPDARGIVVERWYERFEDGRTVTEVKEGELVRVRLRVTVPTDREFVAVEDMMPAGLEVVDLSLRTSGSLGPFESEASRAASQAGDAANSERSGMPWLYGSWVGGWWSPWEHRELRDDRVIYFARMLWKGSYAASYVARATTAGTFVRPPAHAEEMYNPALGGRSEGGVFVVSPSR